MPFEQGVAARGRAAALLQQELQRFCDSPRASRKRLRVPSVPGAKRLARRLGDSKRHSQFGGRLRAIAVQGRRRGRGRRGQGQGGGEEAAASANTRPRHAHVASRGLPRHARPYGSLEPHGALPAHPWHAHAPNAVAGNAVAGNAAASRHAAHANSAEHARAQPRRGRGAGRRSRQGQERSREG